MNRLEEKISAYLKKHAAGKRRLLHDPGKRFEVIVVIPAIQEYENIPSLLNSLSRSNDEAKNRSLILFCVNNAEGHSHEIKTNNEKSIELLKKYSEDNDSGLNISFIDAATPGNELPDKDAGVGLARKIGVDAALYYFNYDRKLNVIVYLDGDCTVAENYLQSIYEEYTVHGFNAAVIDFRHPLDNEAIVPYEIFLRYYVLGLQYAGSPFAYHSVGSTITLTPEIYVKIGGMNKKKAGEDFYFLEKISKVTRIGKIKSTLVYPAARKSWRVPFGTGKSITRFYEEKKDEYRLYDPQIFVVLKKWLKLLADANDVELVMKQAEAIDKELHTFLTEQSFPAVFEKLINNSNSASQLLKQKNGWFDAFKTMKLIHHLRDNAYGNKFMFSAVNELLLLNGYESIRGIDNSELPPLETQVKCLDILRDLA